MAMLIPPFIGGTIMGLTGIFPLPEFYKVFLSYSSLYVGTMLVIALLLTSKVTHFLIGLTRTGVQQAEINALRHLRLFPLYLLIFITVYSIGGASSALVSLEQLGFGTYDFRSYLYAYFGLVPVILITAFPIYFYITDYLGHYLAPRGINIVATPMSVKIVMLGLVTPALVDTVLIVYFHNKTGDFDDELIFIWILLILIASAGTLMALRSFRQGLMPLQDFLFSKASPLAGDELPVAQSIDELGSLSAQLAHLLQVKQSLSAHLKNEQTFVNAILEHAGALVIVLDHEGRISRFNHACQEITGYTEEQAVGEYAWDHFLVKEEVNRVREKVAKLLEPQHGKKTSKFTSNWTGKDGKQHLIEWSNSVLRNEQENISYIISVGTDVTSRVKTENELRESETRLRHAQRLADIGTWELNHISDFLHWTEETYRIFEIHPDEFDNSYDNFINCVHPEDREVVNEIYLNSLRHNSPYDVTHRVITPTGRVKWVHERGETIYCNGQPLKTIGVVQDITNQKQASDEIIHANQLLNAVFNSTHIMIAYLDNDFNFVRVNMAYASTDNKHPDYFIGKNHFELYPNNENEKIFRSVINSGTPYSANARPFEYEFNPEAGVTHWDWTLTPIKDDSKTVSGIVLTLMNVTQRINTMEQLHHRENELRILNENLELRVKERTTELNDIVEFNNQIFSTVQAGITAYDENGNCIFANDAIAKIIGASHQQVLSQNYNNISSWQKTGMIKLADEVMRTGVPATVEIHTTSSFGKPIWLTCHFARFMQRNRPHLMFMAHDISFQKTVEHSLLLEKEKAEQANMAKSQFLSRMSHELRTPMNAIIGFSQLLELQNLSPDQSDYVNEIHEAGEHLLRLITDLLDLSRIEAGRMDVNIEKLQLLETVSRAIQMVQPLFDKNHIVVVNKCNQDVFVLSDATRLSQIIINLLSNAAKYSGQSSTVTVKCQILTYPFIRLSVLDNGPGIPTEKIEYLFRPFERLGAEYTGTEGTGIGLALSKNLADLLGCELGVNSTVNSGTEFWIDIPLDSNNVKQMQK